MPDASFYLWAKRQHSPIADTEFARALLADYNVVVLPGSYLARESNGINPGAGFVRIALVAPLADCLEAADRIQLICFKTLGRTTCSNTSRSSKRPGKTGPPCNPAAPRPIGEAVNAVLAKLDDGSLRVAEKIDGDWVTHQWLKKAVLLSFRLEDNKA
jgi:hypothetical protein